MNVIRHVTRRPLAMVVCLALLLGLAGSAALAEECKGPLYIEVSEGITLTYWIPMTSAQAQYYTTLAEHPYFIWLEEQTGVRVEFIHPSEDQMDQQLNLMIAGGEFYDLLYNVWYPGGPQAGLDEGCFVDLNLFLDEFMPDYKAALYCDDGSFGSWEWGPEREIYQPQPQPRFIDTMHSFDGSLWAATQIWTDEYMCDCGPVIRKDWLDEAGLEIPRTLDELEVVLEAFKNRGGDVIPMSLHFEENSINGWSGSIISAFGINPAWFTLEPDGTTIAPIGYVTPEYKDYLTLMNAWYAAGYIDPDFMNRDSESIASLLLADRLGVMTQSAASPAYYKEFYAGHQAFDLVAMPLPRKDPDQKITYRQAYSSCATNYTVITSSCKNPEIAAQWLNVGYKQEAVLRNTYGIEGETYEMIDGVPYYTEGFFAHDYADQDTMRECELWHNATGYNSMRAVLIGGSLEDRTQISEFAQAQLIWGENASPDINLPYVIFEDDDWGTMFDQLIEAETYFAPVALKFIIGTESLDKFDEYVQTARAMGYDGARDMMQSAYDRMLNIDAKID